MKLEDCENVYNLQDFTEQVRKKLLRGQSIKGIKEYLRGKCPFHGTVIINNFLKEQKSKLKLGI